MKCQEIIKVSKSIRFIFFGRLAVEIFQSGVNNSLEPNNQLMMTSNCYLPLYRDPTGTIQHICSYDYEICEETVRNFVSSVSGL